MSVPSVSLRKVNTVKNALRYPHFLSVEEKAQ